MQSNYTRRSILQAMGAGAVALGLGAAASAQTKDKPIAGFEKARTDPGASAGWMAHPFVTPPAVVTLATSIR